MRLAIEFVAILSLLTAFEQAPRCLVGFVGGIDCGSAALKSDFPQLALSSTWSFSAFRPSSRSRVLVSIRVQTAHPLPSLFLPGWRGFQRFRLSDHPMPDHQINRSCCLPPWPPIRIPKGLKRGHPKVSQIGARLSIFRVWFWLFSSCYCNFPNTHDLQTP